MGISRSPWGDAETGYRELRLLALSFPEDVERLAEDVARSPESSPGRRAIAVHLFGDLDRSLPGPTPPAPLDLLAGRPFSEAVAAEFAARGWDAHPTRCSRLIEYGRRHAPDELRSALRTRIDWGFDHYRSRGGGIREYETGRSSPWSTMHDEMLVALWELGGPLHSRELRRLEHYGYACDPWKRLQGILESTDGGSLPRGEQGSLHFTR